MVGGVARAVVSDDLLLAGVAVVLTLLAREAVFRWWRKPKERRQ